MKKLKSFIADRQSCAFSAFSLETSLARFSSPHDYPELCFLPSGKLVHGDFFLSSSSHLLSLSFGLGVDGLPAHTFNDY